MVVTSFDPTVPVRHVLLSRYDTIYCRTGTVGKKESLDHPFIDHRPLLSIKIATMTASSQSSAALTTAAVFAMGTVTGIVLSKVIYNYQKSSTTPDNDLDQGADPRILNVAPPAAAAPRRYGSVIRLRPEHYLKYRQLHDNVWPQVLDAMTRANIRNFVIYYHKETGILFQHFEWIGHWTTACRDKQEEEALFQADMASIANDPVTRQWWTECEPCQEPFAQWPPNATPPSQQTEQNNDAGNRASWWAPCEPVAFCGHWPMAYAADQRDKDFVVLSTGAWFV